MESIEQVKQACMENNNVLIKDLLYSIGNMAQKKEAFNLIIEHYTNNLSFPVGYSLLFIKELLLNQELPSAMKQINRCLKMGVSAERLAELVFEYLIKPKEAYYRDNFERNLKIIRKHNILFTELNFEFDRIKKLIIIDDIHPELPDLLVQSESRTFLLVDVINIEIISKSLQRKNFLYLMYDNPEKFYYLLLFKDFSGLSQFMERNLPQDFPRSLILFFVGVTTGFLKSFFSNLLVQLPDHCISKSENITYCRTIEAIAQRTNEKISFYKAELSAYYANLTYQYYKRLFSGGADDIKVLLIVSEGTELNKFIVKNWHKAFLELGYRAEMLIETKPYELMNVNRFSETMYEYKPDIVFIINWAVDFAFEDNKSRENILWILRYRDDNFRTYNFKNNMFVLTVLPKMCVEMAKSGIPEDRLLYSMDGVDITLFSKKTQKKSYYACDVVSVNNSVGNEEARLSFFLAKVDDSRLKEIMLYIYSEIEEKALNDYFISDPDILNMLSVRIEKMGIVLNESLKGFFMWFYGGIINCFYRKKVIEWIMDSGITSNIKVWGGSWHRIEKFRNINMGLAKHGVELSDIYGNSKISLCDTWSWNMHERNFEILASGGFPLVKALEDASLDKSDNITNYFKENEEIVLFYSKDDLLHKIQYYLDNSHERERIAENGRQVVINNFSHVAIARKTMDFIKGYYLAGENGQRGWLTKHRQKNQQLV